ncbi:glycosyltransferase [Lentzea albida]|uniref:UDP:flavonoid glycosyltransferase YjiC, YdhE family n=1 Tax=Lentzea albida TaxID=65499 RepID=A0A1H9X3J8_9PSEU|nr:glycosyltransferase [Lentzea albida]SES40710.1 UDP:flavonoid glycosyltransferase YjiC, YdhE family [Lentzea albida]
MRVAILAHGSRGDIQPMVALGYELRRRGHSVVMTVNENLAEWAARSGIDVVPMKPDLSAIMSSDAGRDNMARGKVYAFLKAMTLEEREANRSIIDACVTAAEGADLVLSTITTVYRGECLAKALGVPHRTSSLYPVLDAGNHASFLSPVRDLRLRRLNWASWRLLDLAFWYENRPNIDEMCDVLGIERYRRAPRVELIPSVAMFSGDVASRPAEWHERHEIVGWQALSADLRARLGDTVPESLDAWLDAGSAPIFFGFGSTPVADPRAMLSTIAELTRERGLRGLICAGWSDFGADGAELPDHLHLVNNVDFDAVLPRCRAAVHHGGSGTTASVLRAGLPSVIAGMLADQAYWAWRVEQLGAGVRLPFHKITADRLGAAVDAALACAAQAKELGSRVAANTVQTDAADVVERWAAELGIQPVVHS